MDVVRHVTDVEGIFVGHATNGTAGTGCTVVVCPKGAVGAVDVRGGAPATRETDLLRPEETVSVVHAVVLAGGSAFGLAAATGVAEELERRGVGLDVGVTRVPIVVGACLFDLACGSSDVRPTAADGVRATVDALTGARPAHGNVGAGTGCTVGKLAGPLRAMKSGLGEGVTSSGDISCAAIAAVNAVGDVVDPDTGTAVAGLLTTDGRGIASSIDTLLDGEETLSALRTNTTVSCIVTDAALTKAEATKVAQMSADAYAHAIRPTHTAGDGDSIFIVATGRARAAATDVVGTLATRALERAIVDAVRSAESAYGYVAACDLPQA